MHRSTLRQALIEAGLFEFRKYGYAATGVSTITTRAGAPRGSFYGHFETKEAFAIEALEVYAEQHTAVTSLPDRPASEQLRFAFSSITDMAVESGLELGCLWGVFGAEIDDLSPSIRASIESGLRDWSGRISLLLAAAFDEADQALPFPAEKGAQALIFSWSGALWRSRIAQDSEALQTFMSVVLPLAAPTPDGARALLH